MATKTLEPTTELKPNDYDEEYKRFHGTRKLITVDQEDYEDCLKQFDEIRWRLIAVMDLLKVHETDCDCRGPMVGPRALLEGTIDELDTAWGELKRARVTEGGGAE